MNRLMRRQAFFNACVSLSFLAAGCSESSPAPSASARQRVPLPVVGEGPVGLQVEEGVSVATQAPQRLDGKAWSEPSLIAVPAHSRLVSAQDNPDDNIGPITEEEAKQMQADGRLAPVVDSEGIPPRSRPTGRMPLTLNGPQSAEGQAPSSASEATPDRSSPAKKAPAAEGTSSPEVNSSSRYSLDGEEGLSLHGPAPTGPASRSAASAEVTRLPAPDEEEASPQGGLPSWQESRQNNYRVEGIAGDATSPEQSNVPSLSAYGHDQSVVNSIPSGDDVIRDVVRTQPSKESLAALSDQCSSLVAHGRSLAQRGAMYSARADIVQAERLITQALDAMSGSDEHSQAMSAANIALEEADDFLLRSGDATGEVDVRKIVEAHRTPILRGDSAATMAPIAALQAYYGYAQKQLIKASGGLPVASEAFYWHGKICATMVDTSAGNNTSNNARAMVFHQAALEVDPKHYLAANELGVLMARFGQLQEAKKMLIHSVTIRSNADGWHNLAVVHTRLGETELARKADYERSLAQRSANAGRGSGNELIRVVDSATFVGQSSASDMPVASRPATNTRSTATGTANLPSGSTRR